MALARATRPQLDHVVVRSEEHTSELQSPCNLVCRLLLEKLSRSEEHTSELQSSCNLVCRLLLEKKILRSNLNRTTDPHTYRVTTFVSIQRTLTRSTPFPYRTRWRALFFFFNDTATTEIYTLSLHDALPISKLSLLKERPSAASSAAVKSFICSISFRRRSEEHTSELQSPCNLVCRLLLEKKNIHLSCISSQKFFRTPGL